MKSLPLKWVVNGVDGESTETREDYLIEVSKAGTGFMCIKQHVFEEIKKHPAVKPFNNDIGLPKELDKHMYTFFDSAVRENRYYSEDWTFCENWRDLGGKIWIDSRVLLKHTGHFNFCQENDSAIRKAIAETPSSIKIEEDSARNNLAEGEQPQTIEDIAQEPKEVIITDTPAPKTGTQKIASSKKKGRLKK
jgi:hypothetical protein